MVAVRRYGLPPQPDDYEPPRRVSYDEYLRLEEERAGKYEYHDGLMYPRFYPPGSYWAMAGGTAAHDGLIVNVLTALRTRLRGRGRCRVHSADMKLRAADSAYYPDAYVACGEVRPTQPRLDDPVMICEVRSQSTAEFDKGDKFEAYKHLPSLREYLLLDNRRRQASLFRKSDEGTWTYLVFSAGAAVTLVSLDLQLPLDELYEDVTLDPDPASGNAAPA